MIQGHEFQFGHQIARGLCGPVYRAIHESSGGDVAVKLLTHKAALVQQYFFNEQWLLERIQEHGGHPHLGHLVSSDVHRQPWTLATRYIDSLKPNELVALHNPALVVQVVGHIAAALDYLHLQHPDHPVIHRDVKPDNILVDRCTGNATLIDLSIARSPYSYFPEERLLGTPQYMAPESYHGREGIASDQFGLALSTYLYLTGRHLLPVDGLGDATASLPQLNRWLEPYYQRLRMVLHARPATVAVLLRALAADPVARFSSCGEFAHVLRQAMQADGVRLDLFPAFPLHPSTASAFRKAIVNIAFLVVALMLLGLGVWLNP